MRYVPPLAGIFMLTAGSPFFSIASGNDGVASTPVPCTLYVFCSRKRLHTILSFSPVGDVTSTAAFTTSPAFTWSLPSPASASDLITGHGFAGALPLHNSCIVSTAASLEPSGRNIPYHVDVASILKPHVNAYD